MLPKVFFFPIQTHPLSEDFRPTKHKHIQTQMHVTCTAQYFILKNELKEHQAINEPPRKKKEEYIFLLSSLLTVFWYYR